MKDIIKSIQIKQKVIRDINYRNNLMLGNLTSLPQVGVTYVKGGSNTDIKPHSAYYFNNGDS